MDYGQLAYLKAEELKAYVMGKEAKAEKRSYASVSKYPRAALEAGYEPCSIYGRGNAGLYVTLVCSAPSGANNVKIWLYCGNKAAAYTVASVPAGETYSITLFASVHPEDGEKIKVKADSSGLILREIHVIAEGNGVYVSAAGNNVRCDYAENRIFMAYEQDGYVKVSIYGGSSITAGHGSVFDICVNGSTLCLLLSDDDENLWGITYDYDLNETNRRYLGPGYDSVAIGCGGDALNLAAVKERKVYLSQAENDFSGVLNWQAADFQTEADKVYLSKQSNNPVLFIERNGKLYAKLPYLSQKTSMCISVSLGINLL